MSDEHEEEQKKPNPKKPYDRPVLKPIGSVRELTRGLKGAVADDGFTVGSQ